MNHDPLNEQIVSAPPSLWSELRRLFSLRPGLFSAPVQLPTLELGNGFAVARRSSSRAVAGLSRTAARLLSLGHGLAAIAVFGNRLGLEEIVAERMADANWTGLLEFWSRTATFRAEAPVESAALGAAAAWLAWQGADTNVLRERAGLMLMTALATAAAWFWTGPNPLEHVAASPLETRILQGVLVGQFLLAAVLTLTGRRRSPSA